MSGCFFGKEQGRTRNSDQELGINCVVCFYPVKSPSTTCIPLPINLCTSFLVQVEVARSIIGGARIGLKTWLSKFGPWGAEHSWIGICQPFGFMIPVGCGVRSHFLSLSLSLSLTSLCRKNTLDTYHLTYKL